MDEGLDWEEVLDHYMLIRKELWRVHSRTTFEPVSMGNAVLVEVSAEIPTIVGTGLWNKDKSSPVPPPSTHKPFPARALRF